MPVKKVFVVSGKRKKAIARAVTRAGTGKIQINRIPIEIYEPIIAREKILEPLVSAGKEFWETVDISVSVCGPIGQAEAVRMAIANSLLKLPKASKLRKKFLQQDRTMVVGDSRRKETKKFGGSGARAKEQKSYRLMEKILMIITVICFTC